MREIENAHRERQLGAGEEHAQTIGLTETYYHAIRGTASEFRIKRLADTADRVNFPRHSLSAAQKAEASTNLSALYDTASADSTSSPLPTRRLSWSSMPNHGREARISRLARRLRNLFAHDPAAATRLGSSPDIVLALTSEFGYNSISRDVAHDLLCSGFVSVVDGKLIVHANDHVAEGFPVAQALLDSITRARVLLRDGLVCQLCREDINERFDIDHVVPIAEGGLDTLDNLRITHSRCNRSRAKEIRMQRYGTYGIKGRSTRKAQP
jgi:hypothetical protein